MPHPFRKAPQLPLRGTVMYHFSPFSLSARSSRKNRSAAAVSGHPRGYAGFF